MSSNLPPLSASVTRILSLTGFPPELKTKDIQAAFNEWDAVLGGFKIKWVNDTSLLLVFADANVAKRAYLQTILSPHPSLVSPTSALSLQIKPYDGPDAQAVIYTVNSRRNNNGRGSVSVPNGGPHGRSMSVSAIPGPSGGIPIVNPSAWKNNGAGLSGSMHAPKDNSPPQLPADVGSMPSESTILAAVMESGTAANGLGPRVGDPARRMVGHALGVKHPSVGGNPRASPDRRSESSVDGSLNRAMGGMVIAE